ncbi:MAG TPA: hypothetical protein VE910_00025 [Dongiaceae bacterium]|nr:hypothetical protein [Dongiaceae bacterium]
MASQHELHATNGFPETPQAEARAGRRFLHVFRRQDARLPLTPAYCAWTEARRLPQAKQYDEALNVLAGALEGHPDNGRTVLGNAWGVFVRGSW